MKLNRREALIGISAGLVARPALAATESNLDKEASGTLNVRDFGAMGDGKTDDSSAVTKAIQRGAGKLYFPRGKYLLADIPLEGKNITIDASEATIVNTTTDAPVFRVSKGLRLVRSRVFVNTYIGEEQCGYFLDIDGGLISDSHINIDIVRIKSPNGGVIRHSSKQSKKEFTEGLYFSNITGHRWDAAAPNRGAPMIDINSKYNSCSACNFSIRDVRLLSKSLFARLQCESKHGAAFSQIKFHDISVERCNHGFMHLEGVRMCGMMNIGIFDLKDVDKPLFTFKHSQVRKNTQGCYCRDIFRSATRFVSEGCDFLVDENTLDVSNYIAVGGAIKSR